MISRFWAGVAAVLVGATVCVRGAAGAAAITTVTGTNRDRPDCGKPWTAQRRYVVPAAGTLVGVFSLRIFRVPVFGLPFDGNGLKVPDWGTPHDDWGQHGQGDG